jgi:hypothetical protein
MSSFHIGRDPVRFGYMCLSHENPTAKNSEPCGKSAEWASAEEMARALEFDNE